MFWYEDEVKRVERERDNCKYKPETVFYGSSSIRLWNTLYEDFTGYKPLNLGFGGSTLAACVWYFDRIMAPLQRLKRFVIYAGDNDLGDGRHPEEVFIFYQQLIARARQHSKNVHCHFISIKPSVCRWNIIEQIKYTNKIIEADINKQKKDLNFINIYSRMLDQNGWPIKEYFEPDGLHLSKKGYELWKNTLLTNCLFKI
jgi:lysophospholipase L1-like esterase